MANRQQPLIFRGYVKKEGDHWVAVCVDLNIVAQGSSGQEAEVNCGELISEYIDYVCSEYAHDIGRYLFRPVPVEFIEEYNDVIGRSIQHRPTRSMHPHYFNIEPGDLACSPA